MANTFYTWSNLDIPWSQINMPWNNISYQTQQFAGKGGGSSAEYEKGNPWIKNSKKLENVFVGKIKIFCNIENVEYESILEKNNKNKVQLLNFNRNGNNKSISIKCSKEERQTVSEVV